MKSNKKALRALRAAFPHTLPILAGFGFIGFTYGIYMRALGFSFVYPMLMSLLIFGGSLEFIAANMLLGAFDPLQSLALALMIQARHLFYGISMLDKYRAVGKKKFYLIFGLCDETFSINYSAQIPEDVDRGSFMFWVTALNQFYWFASATLGGLLGSVVSFNLKGVEFVMPAMFIVIFLDQWKKEKNHTSALVGLGASLICLILLGADDFMIPSMVAILGLLTLFGRRGAKEGEK